MANRYELIKLISHCNLFQSHAFMIKIPFEKNLSPNKFESPVAQLREIFGENVRVIISNMMAVFKIH